MIKIIRGEELALRWVEVEPMITKALSYGTGDVTSFGLFKECLKDISQCWVSENEDGIIEGCSITRLIQYENHKELVIVTLTGKKIWTNIGLHGLKLFEHFAKGVDCKYVSVYGRKGWSKLLPKEYKQPYQIYMKEI